MQASDRAKGTIRRYKSAVEDFLSWYERCEQRPLTFATLTPIALVGYRNEVQRTQGRATSTVNGHLSALRAWCAWLTEEHYLEVNPARRIKLVGRQEASKRGGLSDTQANALLRKAQVSRDAQRNYAIVQLLLQTGIRLDECSQLTLEDIEFGERSGRLKVRQGKGNKARTVPLNASARQALAEYLAPRLNCDPTVKAVTLAWPRRSPGSPQVALWQSQKKGQLSTSPMRQMIDVLVRDASARGLVPVQTSAHTLRHTFARNYLAQYPDDVIGLATLLGHTSLDTTRIYSQPTIAQLSTRVEQLRQNAYGEE
ncbi:MAG TPA: tyrosine-type recombinase/integrase [Ktedonobacteraceae bacterium]|nr:tyrosine-type recombinase/integrase [Ktedonobacteraceae bacterium]